MFLVMLGGQRVLARVPWLTARLSILQKVFGLLMLLTAAGMYFNLDRRFQTYVLTTFPRYGAGLTQIEDNQFVRKQLDAVSRVATSVSDAARAPELVAGGQWFNSEPLTLASLRGKVVLIDFWTYSCINCQRTLPYLKAWYDKYKDQGLEIIGVHTPEFAFEHVQSNVEKAVADFGLKYPSVLDNDYGTWSAFGNQFWPRKYLIDLDGFIVYDHAGEGNYAETEAAIQKQDHTLFYCG
jgi:thiol-disulfide isomerase/thioredoxin